MLKINQSAQFKQAIDLRLRFAIDRSLHCDNVYDLR